MSYTPPVGDNVQLNWIGAPYTPPAGDSIVLEFSNTADTQYIGSVTANDLLVFGATIIENKTRYLDLTGIAAPATGTPVLKWTQFATPTGIAPESFGLPSTTNRTQYCAPSSIEAFADGAPRIGGGKRTLVVPGITGTEGVGTPELQKNCWPSGIAAPSVGIPSISPRMVYVQGIRGEIGLPSVQFPPRPAGFLTQAIGFPAIDYKTKTLTVSGIGIPDNSFHTVRYRTQTIAPSSVQQSSVFYDVAVRNTTRIVYPSGEYQAAFSDYAEIRSTRRYLLARSITPNDVSAATVANQTPSLFVTGIEPPTFPIHSIAEPNQTARPSGWNSLQTGTGVVSNPPVLAPLGFVGKLGEPVITPRHRAIEAAGDDAAKYGKGSVTYSTRTVRATGVEGFATGDSGSVTYARRTIYAQGSKLTEVGLAGNVSFVRRSIAPAGIAPDAATNHKISDTKQIIKPFGDTMTLWGSRIIPDIAAVYPQGVAGVCGTPTIANFTQTAWPVGFKTYLPEEWRRFGKAAAFLKTQCITQSFDGESGLVPPRVSQSVLVENRSKTIDAVGAKNDQHGLAVVENAARAIAPIGMNASIINPKTMAAYRVRSVMLSGMDAPYFSGFGVVHNAARVLSPTGFGAQAFGNDASIINTRRTFDRIGGFDALNVSSPMISFAERTITTGGGWYAIGPPTIPLPKVDLHTRYIDCTGNEYGGFGATDVLIHWNKITPRWTLKDFVGAPSLRNVTPELHTYGHNSELFGQTSVRTQWRDVFAFGSNTQLFGSSRIADRTQHITLSNGIGESAVSQHMTVTQTLSPPYSLQVVTLDGDENREGDGVSPPLPSQVGTPKFQQNIIYTSGAQTSEFGRATIHANSIRVEPGIWEVLFGKPTAYLKTRTVAVKEFPLTQVFQPSAPSLSPHTVWAVVEAPEQAVLNHPESSSGLPLHYVDGKDHAPGSVFGSPVVQLKHRVLQQYHFPDVSESSYGQPNVFNRLSYITPDGIRSMRVGWVTLPHEEILNQFSSADCFASGTPTVSRPPYTGAQTISASGFDAQKYTPALIEHFNRTVVGQGWSSERFGASDNMDKPYAWQHLHVGPPIPTQPSGIDSCAFGAGSWISLKVRDLPLTGFDAFICQYDTHAFEQRMRVTGTPIPRPVTAITPVGISTAQSGTPNVVPAVRFIRPDGNSDQYRKGAQHA